ncbi:MAG: NUDIX domain-containing protein [Bdellovibrionaceae bacterium]|nr:NUDIX domain-containing protein [Pseudobdellovibrionaceae bacterium]
MDELLGPAIKCFGQILPGVNYLDRPGAYAFLLNPNRELAVIQTSYGMFLPGGGLDPGEDDLTGLQRELREEIGYELVDAGFLMRAAQYHWSEHYQSYFKKIGGFYEVVATPPPGEQCADGHALLWLPLERAAWELSQEFQRWAAEEFSRSK